MNYLQNRNIQTYKTNLWLLGGWEWGEGEWRIERYIKSLKLTYRHYYI